MYTLTSPVSKDDNEILSQIKKKLESLYISVKFHDLPLKEVTGVRTLKI
jgi:hypothetical protein